MDKERSTNKQIGLWIDHWKAVIVIVTDEGDKSGKSPPQYFKKTAAARC
jgi:hypothetical protein